MYTVLIVDDSSFMRTWIQGIISKNEKIVTAEATNGLEAILQYRKLKPDLVLLDYNMPELSGLEVLKRILKINPNAKVIMCSALGTSFVIEECLLAGAIDFVTKPEFKNLSKIINQNLFI
ncbi:response regulator [Amphibacillus sp. MSJ-3]|uniref:response regulator n=1 Tax=Amphibacillus sp. MSJ-3 TaxID=2841505 RepID=UPI001C0E9BD5|nr:response regulator [Amphibacillus sp. MSJ-3]MBU5595479.1 response regulator [Amphibacillus sp. MSJ-3]